MTASGRRCAWSSVLIIAALAAPIFLSLGHGAEAQWSPNPQRTVVHDSQSRGRTFDVTVSFVAPTPAASTIFLSEGRDGDEWFIPQDYVRFRVVSSTAQPATAQYNGRSSWIWPAGDYVAGQTVTVTYRVRIDPAVADGTYVVNGTVGSTNPLDPAFRIAGENAVRVAGLRVEPSMAKSPVQRTERAIAVANVFYADGAVATGATGSATFSRTGETVSLLPAAQPGRYEGSVVIAVDAVLGDWSVAMQAGDAFSNSGSASTSFVAVKANLAITPLAELSVYVGGDLVNLTAFPTYPNGSAVRGAVPTGRFDRSTDTVFFTEGAPGEYRSSYLLAANASVGRWTVTASVSDAHGNDGNGTGTFEVGFLVMTVEAAPVKPIFNTMERIVLTATVSAPDGSPVARATVAAVFNRTGEAVLFTEVGPGTYRASYAIPPGPSLTGEWSATVNASFPGIAGVARGGGVATFRVVLANLQVAASASPASVQRTQTIGLRAEVRDSAGTLMTGGDVRVEIPGAGAPVPLTESSPGVYTGTYRVPRNAPTGTWDVQMNANFPTAGGQGRATVLVAAAVLTIDAALGAGTYVHRETLSLTATAGLPDGSPADGANASAVLSRTGAVVTMAEGPVGEYRGAYVVPLGAPHGAWSLDLQIADAFGNGGSALVPFTLAPGLLAARVEPSASTVPLTGTLGLQVTASYPDGSPFAGATGEARMPTLDISAPLAEGARSGTYEGRLTVPRGSPTGTTSLAASLADSYGNRAEGTIATEVTPARFAVSLVPSQPTVVRTGRVQLFATAAYPDGSGATGAQVTVLAGPPSLSVPLLEKAAGYEGILTIPADASLGNWTLRAQVVHAEGSGSGEATLSIVPAVLSVAVTADRGIAEPGEPLRIAVRTTYPSGDRLTAGTVSVRVASGQRVIVDQGVAAFDPAAGAFVFAFVLPEDTPDGALDVSVGAADPHGNAGVGNLTLSSQAPFLRPLRSPLAIGGLLVVGSVGAALAYLWRSGLWPRRRSR